MRGKHSCDIAASPMLFFGSEREVRVGLKRRHWLKYEAPLSLMESLSMWREVREEEDSREEENRRRDRQRSISPSSPSAAHFRERDLRAGISHRDSSAALPIFRNDRSRDVREMFVRKASNNLVAVSSRISDRVSRAMDEMKSLCGRAPINCCNSSSSCRLFE